VQGLLDGCGFGGIQNLGVVPECRGLGLGRALLLKALDGFASAGAPRAFLEVTASNGPAVRLYRSMGFRASRTLYRAVELPEPGAVGVGI
jgi:ribosomal protein S18 acetylase RimI-like enzyme